MKSRSTKHKLPIKESPSTKNTRNTLLRFTFVLLIFVAYLIYIVLQQGVQQGLYVSILSWSFFVLSTPIADAGFLIDFPIRLILKVKMIVSESIIWLFAISLNIFTLIVHPEIYDQTMLLRIFKEILEHPFPYWIIILLSMLGTFISIKFADELLSTYKQHERIFYNKHQNKHKFIIMIFLFALILVIYNILLQDLGIELPV